MGVFSDRDLQIVQEKSRAFVGSLKIPLDKLQHEEPPLNPRQRDDKNIARLLEIFRRDGCYRREPGNHVPVLLAKNELPQELLDDNEEVRLFEPKNPLTFLHGRHRIEAARSFLDDNDRWWIADIFSDDLSMPVRNVLREQDSSCGRYFDGDIMRQILISIDCNDIPRKDRFLAKLSPSKQRWVNRLLNQPEAFIKSLISLLPFAGLWPALSVGALQWLLPLHCTEELTRGLYYLCKQWKFILGDNDKIRQRLDPNTAILLQGRCASTSTEDSAFIREGFSANTLFSAIRESKIRQQILKKLLSIQHPIPSLHTFLKRTAYLKPCVQVLKELLPKKCIGTIAQEFDLLHSRQLAVQVQTSEFEFEHRSVSSGNVSLWLAYRILWLALFRHAPVMGARAPWKNAQSQNLSDSGSEPRWWPQIAALATKLGYRDMSDCGMREVDITMFERCINAVRPSPYYHLEPGEVRDKAISMCELLGDPKPAAFRLALSSHPEAETLRIADPSLLFLDRIYSCSQEATPQMTKAREFFQMFFGTYEDGLGETDPFHRHSHNHAQEQETAGHMQGVEETNSQPSTPAYLRVFDTETFGDLVIPDSSDVVQSEPQKTPSGGDLAVDKADARSHSEMGNSNHEAESLTTSTVSQKEHINPPEPTYDHDGGESHMSIRDASCLLFGQSNEAHTRFFTIIHSLGNKRFHANRIVRDDQVAVVNALTKPKGSCFAASNAVKQLKLVAPVDVFEEVKANRLEFVLCAPRIEIGSIIRQLEDLKDSQGEDYSVDVQTRVETTSYTP